MQMLSRISNQDLSKYSGWLLVWGTLLIFLGLFALSATAFTTMVSVVFIGVLILLGGVVVLTDTFTFWWGRWTGFILHLLMGILYVVVGWMCISNPIQSSTSLTFLLGVFYIMLGVFRIVWSLGMKLPRWKLNFISGLLALLLGILIMASWPSSSLYIIGLFVGIDLLFLGWAYIMAGMFTRSITK